MDVIVGTPLIMLEENIMFENSLNHVIVVIMRQGLDAMKFLQIWNQRTLLKFSKTSLVVRDSKM